MITEKTLKYAFDWSRLDSARNPDVDSSQGDAGSAAMNILGGAGIGAGTGLGIDVIRELLSPSHYEEMARRRRRAILLGALLGGGIGTYKHLSDRGQAPDTSTHDLINQVGVP